MVVVVVTVDVVDVVVATTCYMTSVVPVVVTVTGDVVNIEVVVAAPCEVFDTTSVVVLLYH